LGQKLKCLPPLILSTFPTNDLRNIALSYCCIQLFKSSIQLVTHVF